MKKVSISILLVLALLLSVLPMSALAAVNDEDQVTSTEFTLNGYGYGLPTESCQVSSGKTSAMTETYIYQQGVCDEMNGLTTADEYLKAGKQYYFLIRFWAHPDDTAGFADSFDPNKVPLLLNGEPCEFVDTYNENMVNGEQTHTSYYKLPVLEAVPVVIPFSKIVELGGKVAPALRFFELEVDNAVTGSNNPIENFNIEKLSFFIEGDGATEQYFTITHNDYGAILNLLDEGILVREKNEIAEGWENDDAVWCVMRHHDHTVNSLDAEAPAMTVTLDYFKGKIVDGEFEADSNTPATQMSFTNIYTENYISLKLPFVKEVKQGDNTAPGEEIFRLEIFGIGNSDSEEYAQVSCTAEVKTDGVGKFDGEIVFTGPASRIDAMLCEGFYVREVKGSAEGWSYSDVVWFVTPEYDEQQRQVYVVYATTAEESDDGVFYTPAEEPAGEMLFTNTYTVHTHDFTQKHDEHEHWEECDCGEEQGREVHKYGDWEVVIEPTVEAKSEKKHTCTVCGYSETAEIEQVPAETADGIAIWAVLLVVSAGAVTVIGRKKQF